MVVSSRVVLAMGLGMAGLGLLAYPSLGQQQDAALQKTKSQGLTPKAPAPSTFGTIDMNAVFKNYDKVKVIQEEFKASMLAKQNELLKIRNQMQTETEILSKLTPNSVDSKKHQDALTSLKAQFEAGREQAEREFAMREAEGIATVYKEIQSMVDRIAKWRQMTYILRVSTDPINGSDPNSTMQAIGRTVVYADPTNDITSDVIFNLNRQYTAAGGVAPKASSSSSALPGSMKPAGN